jgi:hypothetical protein
MTTTQPATSTTTHHATMDTQHDGLMRTYCYEQITDADWDAHLADCHECQRETYGRVLTPAL